MTPAPTLADLIRTVSQDAESQQPLSLLATASTTVAEIATVGDAVLSHFVEKCRQAGHSWTEIGLALGVSKQAVQKRFVRSDPASLDRFTLRARNVIGPLAQRAAKDLGHGYVGTEHLLLGMFDESDAIAAKALAKLGLTREEVVDAINERVVVLAGVGSGYTPRAWELVERAAGEAITMGHNYVGTEHLLIAAMSGIGGLAEEILQAAGVTPEAVRAEVLRQLAAWMKAAKFTKP